MVDRADIDALLIGSLYGELTPADAARLAAHLESHPADRSALADLESARQAVRDSQFFAVQLEPPQAVSALLLQEAHRRAPRAARAQREGDGWFARLARSVMGHPAMAAAAMLVVVVGVAGTLYINHGGAEFAEQTKSAAPVATPPTETTTATPTATDAAAPVAEPAEPSPPAATTPAEGSATNGYRVDVDGTLSDRARSATKGAPPAPAAHAAAPKKKLLEVQTKEAMPKDLDDTELERDKNGKFGKFNRGEVSGGGAAAAPGPGNAPAQAPANAYNNAAPQAAPPPPPAQPQRQATVAKPTAPPMTKSAPVGTEQNDQKEQKAADGPVDPTTAKARQLHQQAKSLAASGDCTSAATVALDIENLAPAYFKANVATDRALKSCNAYVTAEREKRAEKAASKARAKAPVNADEAPAADATKK